MPYANYILHKICILVKGFLQYLSLHKCIIQGFLLNQELLMYFAYYV